MKKKILIIDDDFQLRMIEKKNLEMSGYEVLESDNAADGIKLATEKKPDLILMDIRLPYKKRGIGAAKIIRNDDRTRNIPIIFVTAYPEWEYEDEVRNITNCGYLTKPFKTSHLLEYIQRYLAKSNAENTS